LISFGPLASKRLATVSGFQRAKEAQKYANSVGQASKYESYSKLINLIIVFLY
jgi:hypothetical protein